VSAGLLGIALVSFVIWIVVDHDRFGSEPMAAAKTDMSAPSHAAKLSPSARDAAASESASAISPAKEIVQLKAQELGKEETLDQAAAGRGEHIVTIIDGRTGARLQVKVPAPAAPRSPEAPPPSSLK
jgi:hypothetical protein